MKIQLRWNLAFRAFILSLLLFLVTSPVNGFSYGWSSIIVSVCFIMLTYILLHDNDEEDTFRTVLWSILLGRLLVDIPLRVISFKDSLCSLMLTVFEVWNILMMAWYYKKKSQTILYIWFIGWAYFLLLGHKQWLEFVSQREETLYDLYISDILNR